MQPYGSQRIEAQIGLIQLLARAMDVRDRGHHERFPRPSVQRNRPRQTRRIGFHRRRRDR
jgi:hypothetical protein